MGFFSKSGKECWLCNRKISEEAMFLDPEDLLMIFKDVYPEFTDSDLKLDKSCLCKICAGILKFTAQDSVAARIRIGEASDKLKGKLGSAKSSLTGKFRRGTDKKD